MDMTDDYWPVQYIKIQTLFYLIVVDAICITNIILKVMNPAGLVIVGLTSDSGIL
jgi:hypothetical protein